MAKIINFAKENKFLAGSIVVVLIVGVVLIVKRLKKRR